MHSGRDEGWLRRAGGVWPLVIGATGGYRMRCAAIVMRAGFTALLIYSRWLQHAGNVWLQAT